MTRTTPPARVRGLPGIAILEVMVGIFVLILGMTAATLLAVQLMRTTSASREVTVATNLARETLEAVRSVRDSNWQANSGSQRDATDTTREHWNDGFKDAFLDAAGRSYTTVLDSSACPAFGPSPCPLSRWVLLDLTDGDTRDATFPTYGGTGCTPSLATTLQRTQLYEDPVTGALQNVCVLPGVNPPTPSRYRRSVQFVYFDPATGNPTSNPSTAAPASQAVWVEVTVSWYLGTDTTAWSATPEREVKMSTTLTDWYGRESK